MSKSSDLISREWVEHNILSLVDPETRFYAKQRLDDAPPVPQITVFAENADENAMEDLKTELQNVLEGQKPCGMNDILRSLIKWTEENKIIPEIYFTSCGGNIWLVLVLRYNGKKIKHEFYVPGGVLCLNNWDMFPTEEEVNLFIEEAKAELLKKGES